MLRQLAKVANRLDSVGLTKEADYIDSVIVKVAGRLDAFDDEDVTESLGELDWVENEPQSDILNPEEAVSIMEEAGEADSEFLDVIDAPGFDGMPGNSTALGPKGTVSPWDAKNVKPYERSYRGSDTSLTNKLDNKYRNVPKSWPGMGGLTNEEYSEVMERMSNYPEKPEFSPAHKLRKKEE